LIIFTAWVVFKSALILYGSKNTAQTHQVSHAKNNSGDAQSIPKHPKCFQVHSLQFGTPAVLAVPTVDEMILQALAMKANTKFHKNLPSGSRTVTRAQTRTYLRTGYARHYTTPNNQHQATGLPLSTAG